KRRARACRSLRERTTPRWCSKPKQFLTTKRLREKKGRAMPSGCPLFCVFEGLEVDAQAELNPARAGVAVGWDVLAGDDTEVREVGGVEDGVEERRMVEGVEEVEGKFDSRPLANLGDFADARVKVLEPEAAQRAGTAGRGVRGQENGTEFFC